MNLEDGYIAVVKEDCPTCRLVVPVLAQLAEGEGALMVHSQDDVAFLEPVQAISGVTVAYDSTLEASFRLNIETVPTLIKVEKGQETARLVAWQRDEWETLTNMGQLGEGLPAWRPGCGAKNVDPQIKDKLAIRFGAVNMASRVISVSDEEDEVEACFERGWSDGFPLVPPTNKRNQSGSTTT